VFKSIHRVMNSTDKPKALLLVSSHCPYCHTLETMLQESLKNELLGELDVINIEKAPGLASQYGVRSVPWLQLGKFLFGEVLTPTDLDKWIEHARKGNGHSEYIGYLLEHGQLAKAVEWIEQGNATLEDVLPLLANLDAKMNIRVGAGAILEHFEGLPALREIIPGLISLLKNDNPAIRTDACHYLSLTHSRDVLEPLKSMLDDEDQQVREVAGESIENL